MKKMKYWVGSKRVLSAKVPRQFKKTQKRPGRKLDSVDKFILVLMKLGLYIPQLLAQDIQHMN